MAVKSAEIPAILAERIAFAHPAPALFSATETADWAQVALQDLLKGGALRRGKRAEVIACQGCACQCQKMVVVRSVDSGQRAFISCDEEPAYGRVSVPLQSLVQFEATLYSLSAFLATLLGIGPPKPSNSGRALQLGHLDGQHGRRDVAVGLDGRQLTVWVGRQAVSLAEVLCWGGNGFAPDAQLMRRLVRRKASSQQSRRGHVSDRSAQQQRSRNTQTRNRALFREAKMQRANEGRSWSAIADAIAASQTAKPAVGGRLSVGTIRRIITEQRRRERE